MLAELSDTRKQSTELITRAALATQQRFPQNASKRKTYKD
jgi:hypothetical protein